MAFRSTSTIYDFLKPKIRNTTSEYTKSGIYELTFCTCESSYIVQTSRNLKQRYQERIRYIKYNDPQLAYVAHILNSLHEYGPINNTLSLLKYVRKGSSMKYFKQFCIQSLSYNKKNLSQNKEQDNVIHCINLYMTFNYDTSTWPKTESIPPRTSLYLSTVPAFVVDTSCTETLVCTLQLSF
jgi:hypothetical protein